MSKIKAMSDEPLEPWVVNLQAGDPDFKTPEHIIRGAYDAIQQGHTHYTATAGVIELRQAVSDKLRRENSLSYDPGKEIVVANGGTGVLALAVATLLEPGDDALVPDPAWPNYEPMISAAGALAKRYPLDRETGFTPRVEELEKAATPRTKVIIVNSPGNPAGGVFSEEVLGEIADFARRRNLTIISDEVYEHIVYDGERHVSVASVDDAWERTVTVNSFSKTYAMTGWRLGYAAAPAEVVSGMVALSSALSLSPSSMAQYAGIAALKGPQECVSEMRDEYRRRRDFFIASLNEVPEVWAPTPKGAFYAFADFSQLSEDSERLAEELTKKGVAAVPGSAFGATGKGFLRFSFASSMRDLKVAAERISEFARSAKGSHP